MAVFNVKQTSIQRKPKINKVYLYWLVLSVKTITVIKETKKTNIMKNK